MITGAVNARHEIVIPVCIRDAAGAEYDLDAILDTGFNGSLALPPAQIAMLGLTARSREQVMLADGSIQHVDVYAGTVVWDGVARQL